jgi:hypothetical protein
MKKVSQALHWYIYAHKIVMNITIKCIRQYLSALVFLVIPSATFSSLIRLIYGCTTLTVKFTVFT